MEVYTVITSNNKDLIMNYIDSLPLGEQANALDIISKLRKEGLSALDVFDTRQLKRKLWEIKFHRHNRFMYVVFDQDSFYILHACKKQKGKAEKFELEKAIKRAKLLGTQLGKEFV